MADTHPATAHPTPTPTPAQPTLHCTATAADACAASGLLATHTSPDSTSLFGASGPRCTSTAWAGGTHRTTRAGKPGRALCGPPACACAVPVFGLRNGAGHVRSVCGSQGGLADNNWNPNGASTCLCHLDAYLDSFGPSWLSLSPSVPLALPLSPKFQAGSPSSGGLLVADTGPVRSSAAWRWAGGNRGSLPVDDDGSVGGRRRAVDGEESQDNTGRRDGPYVNEGARGAQQYRKPGDTTQGPGRAGLRFSGRSVGFFWSLVDWTG